MPTADPTAGRYNPADRAMVMVDLDSFIENEKRYSYMTPGRLIEHIAKVFGSTVIPRIVTKEQVSLKGMYSLRTRPQRVIDTWTSGGFNLMLNLENADKMNGAVLREIEQTQVHTFIWVGDYSVFRWYAENGGLTTELKKRNIKLVILSPKGNGFLHGCADVELHFNETLFLDLEKLGAVPGRLREQQVPAPLKRLEWDEPNTCFLIQHILLADDARNKKLYKGLRSLLRAGTMPDIVLALLLVLAQDSPHEPQYLDLNNLVNQLQTYAVENPLDEITRALWILHEFDPRTVDYVVQPTGNVAFLIGESWSRLREAQSLARSIMSTFVRGSELLEKICASLEIFCCNPQAITSLEVEYLQDWLSVHEERLLASDVRRIPPESLRRYAQTRGTTEERLRQYAHLGVQRIDHIDEFETKVLKIIDDGHVSQDSFPDPDDQPASSSVRAVAA